MVSYREEVARVRKVYAGRKAQGLSERYSPLLPYSLCTFHEREAAFVGLIRSKGLRDLSGLSILDLGCGRGGVMLSLPHFGAEPRKMFGADLRMDSLTEIHQASPHLNVLCANGAQLPFADGSFDLVCQYTLFTSVLSAEIKQAIAAEMLRVLRPKGAVIWYDFAFNNPRNPNVRGIGRREIDQLFRGCRIRRRRVTLAPPLGRLISPLSPFCYHLLSELKVFNTHYLCLIEKPF